MIGVFEPFPKFNDGFTGWTLYCVHICLAYWPQFSWLGRFGDMAGCLVAWLFGWMARCLVAWLVARVAIVRAGVRSG